MTPHVAAQRNVAAQTCIATGERESAMPRTSAAVQPHGTVAGGGSGTPPTHELHTAAALPRAVGGAGLCCNAFQCLRCNKVHAAMSSTKSGAERVFVFAEMEWGVATLEWLMELS